MPDLVFALAADPYRNSRALRQIRTLADADISIQVLSLPGAAPAAKLPENVVVTPVSVRKRTGPAFFFELSQKFLEVASGIKADHYHASDLYVLGAVASAARSRGCSYSYDARELYPYVASTVHRPWVRWFWKMTEKRLIANASAVFTVSEHIAEHLSDTYDIPLPTVVLNVPDTRSAIVPGINRDNDTPLDPLREMLNLDTESKVVLHLGQLRKDRGCDVLVRAMNDVLDAHLVFLGDGPEREALSGLAHSGNAPDRIHFSPPVPPDSVLNFAACATVGVTLLQDTCLNHRYALPNKLFEYIAAGVPVLGSDLPEIRRIVVSEKIGRVVDQSNAKEVGRTLLRMLNDEDQLAVFRRRCASSRETFTWESASQPFLDLLKPLISDRAV